MQKAKHVVLIGEMADRIFRTWSKVVPCSLGSRPCQRPSTMARQHSYSGDVSALFAGDLFIRHVQKLCRSRQPIPRDHSGVSKVRIIRKPLKVTPRKKLRAAAQRAAKHAEEDYSAEEPNVKLSRAFVVVLLLHIVAVGGIFAFSALKIIKTEAPRVKRNRQPKGSLRAR